MKLPEYPLPDGMEWLRNDDAAVVGAYSEEDGWWYGWVRTRTNLTHKELTVAMETKKPLKKKECGTFPSIDAACKFISAYLLLGDTDD
jgi:hypothetical protein